MSHFFVRFARTFAEGAREAAEGCLARVGKLRLQAHLIFSLLPSSNTSLKVHGTVSAHPLVVRIASAPLPIVLRIVPRRQDFGVVADPFRE